VVVRTEPPPRKRDVPLNTAIVVVFSEPIAGASLSTASVQLRAGQSAVSGTVGFLDPTLDPTHVTAEFVPDAPLSVNTEYTLIVTVIAQDARGFPVVVSSLSSSDFTVAGVWGFSQGKLMVIGASQGNVTITAMSDTLRATASITVTPGVAPFGITPESGMAI